MCKVTVEMHDTMLDAPGLTRVRRQTQASSAAAAFGMPGCSFALGGTASALATRGSCISERCSFAFAERGNAVVKQELLSKRPL